MRGKIMRLGLTGGVGSGKSTLAAQLAACGAAVIDADAIARALTAPGGAAIAAIAETFGAAMIDANGALDRARMRALAFAQPGARQRLEAILHPLIAQETARQLAQAANAGHTLIVHDVPLLVESRRMRAEMCAVLVVDCPHEVQIERVMARSALSRAQVEAIIATQASRCQRLACADWVVYNDAAMTLAGLRACARAVVAWFQGGR